MLYFPRITMLNYFYAWWHSLRQPVGAWSVELPGVLAGRFQRLRPYALFTHDEWVLLRAACFDAWKEIVLPEIVRTHRCVWRYRDLDIDFSRNLWQIVGAEFERQFLFLASIRKKFPDTASRPQVMESWIARMVGKPALRALYPDIEFRESLSQRRLEGLHEWVVGAAYAGRTAYQFLRSLAAPRMRFGVRPVVWQGVSPQEIPDRDHRLNFAWAVQYGALSREDVLYLLPCRTNESQRAYLTRNGAAWAEPQQLFSLLPLAARIRALACALHALIAGTLNRSAEASALLPRLAAGAGFWSELADTLGIQRYVTSISQAWPEKAELAVMKARGIRSVNWAYSANSLQFATSQPGFRDVGVARSIVISDESWVWNSAYRGWLLKRQLEPSPASTIIVAGPLMCGDASWMKSGAVARRQLGLPREGTCIGVFDMPFVNERWRDRYGGGPGQFEFADYEAFCEGICELLDRLPGSFALIKPKRSFNDPYRDFPQVLRSLIDAGGEYVRLGRVFLVDENVDPYLPVSASDVAIGMPFTSPILAALAIGRAGAFYDPRRRASDASVPGLRELTIQSIEELTAFVGSTMRGKPQPRQLADRSVLPPPPAFPPA